MKYYNKERRTKARSSPGAGAAAGRLIMPLALACLIRHQNAFMLLPDCRRPPFFLHLEKSHGTIRDNNNFVQQHAMKNQQQGGFFMVGETTNPTSTTTTTTNSSSSSNNIKTVIYRPSNNKGLKEKQEKGLLEPVSSTTKKPSSIVGPAADPIEQRGFPFSMIVGQNELKEAAVIAAANPRVSGILIGGRHGTGKSAIARAIHQLLPKTIERVKGSSYNIDPSGNYGVDTFLLKEVTNKGISISELETEFVQTPFVQIPLNIMEDSLCGSVDIEQSMRTGETVFAAGLLARAHRGILYIDDIHLLDDDILSTLFDVISDGWVTVEREGMSVRYPCVPIVIATWNPDEGEITKHFTDRIGMSLSADVEQLTVDQRVEVVDNVINFSGDVEVRDRSNYAIKEKNAMEKDESLRNVIAEARQNLSNVHITHDQILYLCEEATRAGCDGHRGEIFATHIAKTCAAIEGRNKVIAKDLKTAVRLALAPRSKYFTGNWEEGDVEESEQPVATSEQQQSDSPVPITPPPGEQGGIETEEEMPEDKQVAEQEMQQESSSESNIEDEQEQSPEPISIPDEFMFGVNMVPIDPGLLLFMERTKKGRGGKSSKMYNLERGRFCKAIFPKPGQRGRIAVGATIRAAAPYQKMRRKIAEGTKREGRAVYVDKSDFRIKRMTKKSGALVIFVVDASGSMALNRMDAAKGAAISLLSEAYKARDKISLISFHQERANVVVPPTKSTALTKSRLESMPCGGGSPLAHALLLASKVALNEKKVKKDVGKVIIVLLTDGRCNVPLSISSGEGFDPDVFPSIGGRPTKEFLEDEVISCAKSYRKLDLDILVIDTEDKFVATGIGKKIADAAMGRYCQIDPRDVETIKSVTKETM